MKRPRWSHALPWADVEAAAKLSGLPTGLIAAIAETESSCRPSATRYESAWKYFYHVDEYAALTRITADTERVQQATSWGLMQVMGSVARELGYEGLFPDILRPDLNLYYGARKLRELKERYEKLDYTVAAYNAGKPRWKEGRFVNHRYVDKVMELYRQF